MTPAGIEPATFGFVAQHINHCATAIPRRIGIYPNLFTIMQQIPGILWTYFFFIFYLNDLEHATEFRMIHLNFPSGCNKLWNKGKHNDRHFLKCPFLYTVYPSCIFVTRPFLPDTILENVCVFTGWAFPPVFYISRICVICGPDPLYRYYLSSYCHLTSSSVGRHTAATVFPLCALPALVGLFAKFLRAIVSYVVSARLSVSWNISVPIGRIFFKVYDGFLF